MDQTFHTPSFGDEEFHILPIDMNSVGPETMAQAVPITSYANSPPLSHPNTNTYMDMDLQTLAHQRNMNIPNAAGARFPIQNTTPQNPNSLAPKFPPQNFDVPDISVTNHMLLMANQNSGGMYSHVNMPGGVVVGSNMYHGQHIDPAVLHHQQQQHLTVVTGSHPAMSGQHPAHQQLTTISQSQISSQLGFQTVVKQNSPTNSTNSTSSIGRESSEDSDDSLPLAQLAGVKRPASSNPSPVAITIAAPVPDIAAKKPKAPKRKKKKDPNEPQKPVSAYALFFRDTQAAIKKQNPSASFGEVSKIVASMWDGLDPDHKNMYKKKTEMAKKEYLKQLAAYRASLVSQPSIDPSVDSNYPQKPLQSSVMPAMTRAPPVSMSPNAPMTVNSPQPMFSPAEMSHHLQAQNDANQGAMMGRYAHVRLSPPQGGPPPPQQFSPPRDAQLMPPQIMPQQFSPPHAQSPVSSQHSSPPHLQPIQPLPNMTGQMDGSPPRLMNNNHPPPLAPSVMIPGSMMPPHQMMTQEQMLNHNVDLRMMSPPGPMCVRNGCTNPAISSPTWDNEYCSNDCVVSHCRDVFTAWVASRQAPVTYAHVK